MDPNANLAEQEQIILQLHHDTQTNFADRTVAGTSQDRGDMRLRLQELREALRDWLAAGGFEPRWIDSALAAHNFRRWNNQ